jgi:hypothetical protein
MLLLLYLEKLKNYEAVDVSADTVDVFTVVVLLVAEEHGKRCRQQHLLSTFTWGK